MSKTFKSTMTDRTLQVEVYHDLPHIAIEGNASAADGFFYAIADAPALALAILEAAGCLDRGDTLLGDALRGLKGHLHNIEQEAKEAADREALEAEAWELWLAYHPSTAHKSFSDLLPPGQNDFLNIARKAREIHKAKS